MRFSPFVIVAACSVLAACAADSTYAPSDPLVQIDSFYDDGAADRDIQLVVIGDPFPLPDQQFNRALEADLQNTPLARPPTRPVLAPGSSAKPIYRLVYAFNPSPDMFGNTLCRLGSKAESVNDWPARPPGGPSPTGDVHATAAFCVEYRSLSEISGQTIASGPADPHFVQMARLMMGEVFRKDIHPHTGNPNGNAAKPAG